MKLWLFLTRLRHAARRAIARLFLGLVFFGFVTPVAFVRRLFVPAAKPGWVTHTAVAEPSSQALYGFIVFLRTRKRYWLVPIVLVLFVLGLLLVLSEGAAVAPFIYTLF